MGKAKKGGFKFNVGRKNVNVKWKRPYFLNKIAGLCPPAALYLVLSILSFLGILFQNCNFSDKYVIGDMMIDTPCHNAWFFVGKAIYIALWTWLLNLLCSKGFSTVSWFLVLLPFIAMFMILGVIMILAMKTNKEGFIEGNKVKTDDADDGGVDEDEDEDDDDDDDEEEDEEKE